MQDAVLGTFLTEKMGLCTSIVPGSTWIAVMKVRAKMWRSHEPSNMLVHRPHGPSIDSGELRSPRDLKQQAVLTVLILLPSLILLVHLWSYLQNYG